MVQHEATPISRILRGIRAWSILRLTTHAFLSTTFPHFVEYDYQLCLSGFLRYLQTIFWLYLPFDPSIAINQVCTLHVMPCY